ncbi:hypothetical protein TRIP_B300018 [uncultured Desulfatiglans sp.]|nr:hypothetical protein TRIP_B300018 [uncultured Desulfatiglans sp.]
MPFKTTMLIYSPPNRAKALAYYFEAGRMIPGRKRPGIIRPLGLITADADDLTPIRNPLLGG